MITDLNLYEFTISIFFWAGIVTMLVGFCILLAPDRVIRTGRWLNRWVSTEAFFDKFDAPARSERFFYRHHTILGIMLVLGAAYIFYSFVFAFDAGTQTLSLFSSPAVNDWLITSLSFLNIMFSIVIFLIGIIMTLRPSVLKNIENLLNRWFTVDERLKTLDIQFKSPEQVFTKRPRLLGLLIVAGSLYICINLWSMM
ncbi:MAG: hypothetical protein ACE5GZ_05185 [Gammaproteobacteria bacterium]